MKLAPSTRGPARKGVIAFTMVEVALSIAIIAFALVAIIGVLPTGMQVQKDNREETIIGNDASFLIEVLRNGNTNANAYVLADRINWIVNTNVSGSGTYFTNYQNGYTNQAEMTSLIVGLLSLPKYETNGSVNKVVAQFRANSGPLVQQTTNAGTIAFTYQVTPEIVPFATGVSDGNLTNNLWDIRLLFQWPVYPNGKLGNGRKIYRALVSGRYIFTNNLYYLSPADYFTH